MVRRLLVVCAWVGLVFPWAGGTASGQPARKPAESPAVKLAAEVKALGEELKEARETVKKVTDRTVREKLELQISRAERRVTAIKEDLDALAANVAMADADFKKLLAAYKAESFDKGKASFISGLKGIRLNCEQLKVLMKGFDFDDSRITAGLHLYPMLTDPENIFVVNEVFSFDSKKKAFQDAIAKLQKKNAGG
jgi:hypothetical protein